MRMALHNKANHNNNVSQQLLQHQQQKQEEEELVKVKPVFHDFLGRKKKPIAGPHQSFSSTTVIGSERHEGNQLEGIPFYGLWSDFSGSEIGNKLIRNKRSVSDSTFWDSTRDAFQVGSDSLQNSHLMKILRNTAGGERRRHTRPKNEVFLGMPSMNPSSGSQIFQPSPSTKIDGSKWEQSILMNVGPSVQHQPHGPQAPFMHQITSNKIRDTSPGPPLISQSAADEGSRTGMKVAGILSSINAASEKTPSTVLLGGNRTKPVTNIIDPESSTLLSRHEKKPSSCQMTIFYGGQAHVFDVVQPKKADDIMALAGSNGGSWSTTFSPESAVELVHDSHLVVENETAVASSHCRRDVSRKHCN